MSRRAWVGLLVPVLALLWGRSLVAGFWLDETVTVYVVKDGFAEALERARAFQGQSPLYFAIAWLARAALGESELALRLPSLVFLGAALVLVARLGTRIADAETGRLAALSLACLTYHEAADARPYALATLAVAGAALAAVRWGERPTLDRALAFAGASALVAWAHPVFAATWPALAWLAVRSSRLTGRKPIGVVAVALVALVAGVLVLPLGPQLASLAARRELLSFATPPAVTDLLADLVRPRAVAALVAGVALASLPHRRIPELVRPPGERALLAPLLAWHALPPLALFAVSRAGDAQVYVARYFACCLPAFALLFAWLTRAIVPARARALVAAVFVALSIVRFQEREDWGAAIAAVRAVRPDAKTLVLVRPGLVESDDTASRDDPAKRAYLLAPLAAYPIDGGATVRLVPHALVKATEPVFEELVAEASRSQRTIVVARSGTLLGWLDHRLGVAGLTSAVVPGEREPHEKLRVLVYERR